MTSITRFERARLVTARALQLSFGAPPLVKVMSGFTAYDIAKEELEKKIVPLAIMRRFPDGSVEKIAI